MTDPLDAADHLRKHRRESPNLYPDLDAKEDAMPDFAAAAPTQGHLYTYEPGNGTRYTLARTRLNYGDISDGLHTADLDAREEAWRRALPGAPAHEFALITIVSPTDFAASYPLAIGETAGPLHAGYLAEKFPALAPRHGHIADALAIFEAIALITNRPLVAFADVYLANHDADERQRILAALRS